jgi:outer membrane protein OmpA-like peptidoglycan-associated protein
MRTFAEKSKAPQQTTTAKAAIPSWPHFKQSSEVSSILNLQRTVGNHAVQRIQAKLTVSSPGDIYEQEADRVADHVMDMRDSEQPCAECDEEKQLRQAGSEDQAQTTTLSEGLIGGGQPLGPNSRAFFEPLFGRDFSQVRLHTGDRAADAARSIDARAFTSGNHVVMGAGEYQPSSSAGKKLLAHELTHVVQQRQAPTSAIQRQPVTPPPLPTPKKDKKTLATGEMTWELKAVSQRKADISIDFTPDKSTVDGKSIAFAQTVKNQFGTTPAYAGSPIPFGDKATYSRYEETTQKRIDHAAKTENDPFYGAMWDQSAKKWVTEGATWGKPGSSTKGTSSDTAKLHDAPEFIGVRGGHGNFEISFESVPMIQETREPLGALTWGYKIEDKADSPIVLTGAEKSDCVDAPSASFARALDKFYEAKFDVILDSFPSGAHALTKAHKRDLDTVVTKLKADNTLKVQLAGAADLKEANAQTVSKKRANAAKAYLEKKGVKNTITIESYGSDWAQVATSKGTDEPKNRRVQVWVHK